MKPLILAVAVCAIVGLANGQVHLPRMISAQSHSGQFAVTAPAGRSAVSRNLALAANTNLTELEPMLLAVSAERIKQSLWRELGATDPWRGKIFLVLHPASFDDEPVTITSERFTDGWSYRVDLPDVLTRVRFIRAMTQVLLLEMANRAGALRSAEIPLWLTEGLTQQLLTSGEMELTLPPPGSSVNGLAVTRVVVNAPRTPPLTGAHQQLLTRPPLTFDQLSWPTPDDFSGEAGEAYRSNAQLFVADLLAFKDGRESLRAMLGLLPEYYNWQMAFLRAFKAHFGRPLDVEKWWALRLVEFIGRDLAQTWTLQESWGRLDAVVRSPVQVRTGANELPLRAEVTLQNIVRDWEPLRQTPALQGKIRELGVLRVRIAQPLVGLADDYRQALSGFLAKRDKHRITLPFTKQPKLSPLAEETLKRLDELDARREALRPLPAPVAAKANLSEVLPR
jgi:hypothetical protein